jgi:nitrogen-specific signal transduction histidine kinase
MKMDLHLDNPGALEKRKCIEDLTGPGWSAIPQREFFELILNVAPEPILIANRCSTEVLFANRAAEELIGSSLTGRNAENELAFEYRPISVSGLKISKETHPAMMMRESGEVQNAEVVWHTRNGKRKLQMSGASMNTPINGVYLCIYILKDITDLNEMIEEKQRLISQLSHEVRNPLSIILGFSDLLKEQSAYFESGEV